MDINIRRFPVEMKIGHLDAERVEKQTVFFDLDIQLNRDTSLTKPRRDELEETVDYGMVMNALAEMFDDSEYQLLETVCERAGHMVLENFPGILALRLAVEKTVLPLAITRNANVIVQEFFNREDRL